jgi:glutamyl-Q tRNA(Asp) synthetase
VVVDDALQGVTHVIRGADLRQATAIHRLLQTLLDLPVPHYEHHDLIRDQTGRKLAKSKGDMSLAEMREQGATPTDIRSMLGFEA